MKRLTIIATACVLAALAVLATRVGAQESNTTERTFMTFSAPVELPGVTLEAGTYEFRLADTESRNVVQVLRKDSREPMGQWTFVQSDRPQVSGETVVMFKETKEGTTPAVQFWYYPNEKIGKEFIYPKDQAHKIAQRTGETVLSTEGPVSATASAENNANVEERRAAAEQSNAVATAQPSAPAGSTTGNRGLTNEQPREPESLTAQSSASAERSVEPEPAPRATAQVEPAPRPVGTSGSGASAEARQASELPRTASPLPLSGLIGLLSLAGAAGLRAMRR
jgi:hypothetical protein